MGKRLVDRPEKHPTSFVYTEEMRDRALRRIAEKRLREDEEAMFDAYMRTMFRAFMSRLHAAGILKGSCDLEDCGPASGVLKPRVGRPRAVSQDEVDREFNRLKKGTKAQP